VTVTDREILPWVEATLDRANPREWYWALMDYGTHLKALFRNPARRSSRHRRQSRFEGSRRQLRGRILRHLTQGTRHARDLAYAVEAESTAVAQVVRELEAEGFITVQEDRVGLRQESVLAPTTLDRPSVHCRTEGEKE
jgi:A/G-specific adenine glycosylase